MTKYPTFMAPSQYCWYCSLLGSKK